MSRYIGPFTFSTNIFTMGTKPHHDADYEAIKQDQGGYTLKPRAFNIVWGNDNRYWRIPSRSPSTRGNNDEVAELVQVSWLEVTGSVQLQPSKIYQLTFKLSFKEDAFGWSGCPVFLMAKVGKKGKYKWRRLKELESLPKEKTEVPSNSEPFLIEVPSEVIDSRLYFGLYEVWSGKWKGGLRVHEATVKEKK
ncbi:protein PHLOEM PROTEIN 2-LIKE A9 [Herrania umbratica]|uniref:Protein PHLOEM PROTEIN 2-LIKE A9 n=1 Tax=Herrania umbratica TaxID=108875 RepID=A0A6J1B6C6_9ROSI|nr:protein PHLOEM PROTEIN 2-LIKE A9 [Herrania umbratica]